MILLDTDVLVDLTWARERNGEVSPDVRPLPNVDDGSLSIAIE